MKEIIATADAPPALGPYAQGVRVGDAVYVSGQLPMDPRTRQLISGTIAAQTEQIIINMRSILEEAGVGLDDVVKVTIFLTNIGDFDEINRVYGMFFNNLPPARSMVEVSRLPKGASIEMDCIAIKSGGYVDHEIF